MLLAAIFDASLGIFHTAFWALFGWPRTLGPAGNLNSSVTQILNLCLTFVFFAAAGWLAHQHFTGADPRAMQGPLTAMTAFWLFRAALQPLYFGLNSWLSAAFFALFLVGAVLHALPLTGLIS